MLIENRKKSKKKKNSVLSIVFLEEDACIWFHCGTIGPNTLENGFNSSCLLCLIFFLVLSLSIQKTMGDFDGIRVVTFLCFMRRGNIENKYLILAISLMLLALAGKALGASIPADIKVRFLPKGGGGRVIVGFQPLMVISPTAS